MSRIYEAEQKIKELKEQLKIAESEKTYFENCKHDWKTEHYPGEYENWSRECKICEIYQSTDEWEMKKVPKWNG